MEITIKNLQKKIRLRPEPLKKIVRKILRREKAQAKEVSFCFVSSQKIRSLNRKFLNRAYTTDVLAFLLEEDPPWTGEIIISTDAIKQNAFHFKTDIAYEGTLYVVHGLLHLLGYDDQKPKQIRKIRAKEEELMQYLKKDIKGVFTENVK